MAPIRVVVANRPRDRRTLERARIDALARDLVGQASVAAAARLLVCVRVATSATTPTTTPSLRGFTTA